MVEFIEKFYMNFTGASWWEYGLPETWENMAIITFIYLGVTIIPSLVWIIVRVFNMVEGNSRWNRKENREARSQKLRIKPPLFFIYFIFNTIVNILVMMIGMTVGGVIGFGVAMAIWLIWQLVAIITQHDDGDGKVNGIFLIFARFDQYGNKLAEYLLHREKYKEKYQQYLKIEY